MAVLLITNEYELPLAANKILVPAVCELLESNLKIEWRSSVAPYPTQIAQAKSTLNEPYTQTMYALGKSETYVLPFAVTVPVRCNKGDKLVITRLRDDVKRTTKLYF